MRSVRLIGVLIAMLAVGAITIATASAAETLWKWLPGSVGETLTGKTGKFTISGKSGTFTCSKSTIALPNASLLEEGSTEKKAATLALVKVDIEGCTSLGLPVNSVGDSSGTILLHFKIHNCMIGANHSGWSLVIFGNLHVEIPATKLLWLFRGFLIILLEAKEGTKAKTFSFNMKTVKGEGKEQEFKKCEGGEEAKLEGAVDSETFEPVTMETKEASITFDGTKDKEGEEMMEK
jgi:hypothetical protein